MRSRALILVGAAASLVVTSCGTGPSSTSESPSSPAGAELSYVALGDSLATTFPAASAAYPTLYGEATAEALGQSVEVVNEAIVGITSEELLAIVRSSRVQEELAEAEIVTVNIGTNDFRPAEDATLRGGCVAKGDLGCHEKALEGVKKNFEAIVQEILSLRSPSDTVIRIVDNFNRFVDNDYYARTSLPKNYSETIRPIYQEWNEFTCDLARSNDIPCVSLYEAFNGPRGTKSPYQAGLLVSDGQHLSDKGHEAVAAELEEVGFAPLA